MAVRWSRLGRINRDCEKRGGLRQHPDVMLLADRGFATYELLGRL
jgi:hypothetical protein